MEWSRADRYLPAPAIDAWRRLNTAMMIEQQRDVLEGIARTPYRAGTRESNNVMLESDGRPSDAGYQPNNGMLPEPDVPRLSSNVEDWRFMTPAGEDYGTYYGAVREAQMRTAERMKDAQARMPFPPLGGRVPTYRAIRSIDYGKSAMEVPDLEDSLRGPRAVYPNLHDDLPQITPDELDSGPLNPMLEAMDQAAATKWGPSPGAIKNARMRELFERQRDSVYGVPDR